MRLHCHQASRRLSMTIDRPPLLMAHIDPGVGPNISMCVRGVGAMCIEKVFLTMNVVDR